MPPATDIADPAVYDLRGLNCPLPVLRAKKRLVGMAPGARLWIETTDPLAAIDIPAFCREEGHRLVESAAVSGGNRFLVERGEAAE
jgi:tRNA 2-thiouridine synthesizing protein A